MFYKPSEHRYLFTQKTEKNHYYTTVVIRGAGNDNHYLRTVKFKHKYILISHVGAEALNTERILTSRTNSPPAQISTQ
jgi:hypothetical protein